MSSLLGLYNAIVAPPTLVQFLDKLGNTIVVFDVAMSETYGFAAKPTEYPIETGASISDHIIRSPASIEMTCIVSDSPISGVQAQATVAATVAASAVLPPLGVATAGLAYAAWKVHAGSSSPSKAAYATLVKLMLGDPDANPPIDPQTFTMVSALGTFDNMAITSLSVPRDAQTGDALVFQMKLERLKVVQSQSISLTDMDAPGLSTFKEASGDKQGGLKSGFTPGRLAGLAATGEGG